MHRILQLGSRIGLRRPLSSRAGGRVARQPVSLREGTQRGEGGAGVLLLGQHHGVVWRRECGVVEGVVYRAFATQEASTRPSI